MWAMVVPALLLAGLSTNPALSCVAVLSLAFIVAVLLRPGQPPVLMFICFMQWLQGALLVLYADVLGVEVRTLGVSRSIDEASYLTMAWVVLLAAGASLVTRGIKAEQLANAREHVLSYSQLILVYLGWSIASSLLAAIAPAAMRQVVIAVSGLRWAVVFALVAYGWSLRRGQLLVLGVLGIEVVTGFLSFFSDFKTPLFVLALALLSAGYRPNMRHYAALAALFALTLYFGVIWSAIKADYRDTLNEGTGRQAVTVDTGAQVQRFLDLVGSVDADTFAYGVEALVRRVAYVEYFALVLDYVPRFRAHEDGALWIGAVEHILFPRILFPDKARLVSDTEQVAKYTGLRLEGTTGTSITIGVPAETYVDLGIPWMFLVAVSLGMLYGAGYRYCITYKDAGGFAQGLAVALFLGFTTLGSSAAKVLGAFLTMAIMTALFLKLGWPIVRGILRFRQRA